jgi:hypothetical protein
MSEVSRGGGDRINFEDFFISRGCFAAIGFIFGPGSPLAIIPDYAGVIARKHNFAPHAMEFLVLAGKPVFIDLVG